MGLQILLLQINFGYVFIVAVEVCPCNICLGCYIIDNGDLYSRLSSDIEQTIRLPFPRILVLVLLLMVIDYFNSCTHARSLGIAAQIKFMGEPC
jgi:hypothetical protein